MAAMRMLDSVEFSRILSKQDLAKPNLKDRFVNVSD
jgi:hypothetical protein